MASQASLSSLTALPRNDLLGFSQRGDRPRVISLAMNLRICDEEGSPCDHHDLPVLPFSLTENPVLLLGSLTV